MLLRGASVERTPERVPPTLEQAYGIADALDPRWRMLVVLAVWSGLRWGELTALRRRSIDLPAGQISVTEQFVQASGQVTLGPPKSEAGRRTMHLPPHLLPDVAKHLDQLGRPRTGRVAVHRTQRRAADPDRLLPPLDPCTPDGWRTGVRFHDLRHLSATRLLFKL